ncbi:uncharacterized protein EV420DRAFT_1472517 [Desarmillaria tabescens]|uniref:Uncharacterized protein n=1 Tax=Armillaria tabescens TaxID=1929756 RepID=A0AA39TXH2_ARMTA|nr:uncharacterized protein EV420DRAFT_1472517 [Desarmillaria tabescens]KAK0469258.1 hypothetical protein EV420DRAFT_1472517 [Desarmillaria tabescens]
MQRATQASRPAYCSNPRLQAVVSQDSEGWMNTSLPGADKNPRAVNYLSGPFLAGHGALRPNSNASRYSTAMTGGMPPLNATQTGPVRPEPTRRYSVPYLGHQNQGRENQRPVVGPPQRPQAVRGTHRSVGNPLSHQSQTVSHPTISKPATCTTALSQNGRSSNDWPTMQADHPHQRNPAKPFYGPQRQPFVPLDNIPEENLPNGGGFSPFPLLPDTGRQAVDTSMNQISRTPRGWTENADPAHDENVERIMQALEYHPTLPADPSNDVLPTLAGDNHHDSRLSQLLSVAVPYQAVVMPRPASLDNILDNGTIQIPSAAMEIMDQGGDKMDELGRTLLDHLLSFACTASMLTRMALQMLRQAETRYGPHAEMQLRLSLTSILMTAYRQYFVGEGSILSDRLSITLAEAVGEFFVSGLLDGQDFFVALDTLLTPSAHNHIAAMSAILGSYNDMLFRPAHSALFHVFCEKLAQNANGIYVHGEGIKNGQAIVMGIVGRLRAGSAWSAFQQSLNPQAE